VETVHASTIIKIKSLAILTDFNLILKTDKRQPQQTLFYQ
jgi:hypothetical protein